MSIIALRVSTILANGNKLIQVLVHVHNRSDSDLTTSLLVAIVTAGVLARKLYIRLVSTMEVSRWIWRRKYVCILHDSILSIILNSTIACCKDYITSDYDTIYFSGTVITTASSRKT